MIGRGIKYTLWNYYRTKSLVLHKLVHRNSLQKCRVNFENPYIQKYLIQSNCAEEESGAGKVKLKHTGILVYKVNVVNVNPEN